MNADFNRKLPSVSSETSFSRRQVKDSRERFSTLDRDFTPLGDEPGINKSNSSTQHDCVNKTVSKHRAREILRHLGKRIFSTKQKSNFNPKNYHIDPIPQTYKQSLNEDRDPSPQNMASAEVSHSAEVSIPPTSGLTSQQDITTTPLANEDMNNNPRDLGDVSVAELEGMLEQFPEYDKRVKIRNTLIQLKKELEEKSGQGSQVEETKQKVLLTPTPTTSDNTPPKETNTTSFTSFKVSNSLTRAESAKTTRSTHTPVSNIGRAGSFNLTRPKDFLASKKTDNSTPDTTTNTSWSAQRSASPQNTYNRVTAPFGKSLTRRASSPAIPSAQIHTKVAHTASPLAQPIKRSDSTKENYTVSPILVGQGNVRRSRSILGRVLGLKIVSENNPSPPKSFPQVVTEVIREQPAAHTTQYPPSSLDSSGEKSPHLSVSSEDSDDSKSGDNSTSSSSADCNSYSVQTAEQRKEIESIEIKSSKTPSLSSEDSEACTSDEIDKRISYDFFSSKSEESENEKDNMDRYARRAMQSRVSVKAQIMAAEDGKMAQPDKPRNVKTPQRSKPLFSGENLTSRLNKYSSTIDNPKQTEQIKTRNTLSFKSRGVENNSSKFEKNNNIVDSKPTKIENTTPVRRTRREISSTSSDKVNGAKTLEEVAKITTEELKYGSRKHSSSSNKSSKATTPVTEVNVTLPGDDIENSLNSWSERRRKKRAQKDLNGNITSTPPPTPVEETKSVEISVEFKTEQTQKIEQDVKSSKKNYTLNLEEQKFTPNGDSPVSPMSPTSSTESTGSGRARRRRGRITSHGESSVTSEKSPSLPGTPVVEEQSVKAKLTTPQTETASIKASIEPAEENVKTEVAQNGVAQDEIVEIKVEFEETKVDVVEVTEEEDISVISLEKCDTAEADGNSEKEQSQNEVDKDSTSVSDTIEVTLSDDTKESSHDIDTNQFTEKSDNYDVINDKNKHEGEKGKSKVINEPELLEKDNLEIKEEVPTVKPRRRRIKSNAEDGLSERVEPKATLRDTKEEEPKTEKNEKFPKKKSGATSEDSPPNIVVTRHTEENLEIEQSENSEDKTEAKEKNMQITLDNLEQCKDEAILEEMLEKAAEYDDRRKIRKALRALRKANNDVAISNKLSMLKSTHKADHKSRDDIAISTSKFSRSNSATDGNRVLKQETNITKKIEISGSGTRVSASLRTTMSTRETKKIGSIFDREDDEDTKPKGGSRFDLERRKNERRHDIQRIRSLPAASSKDARKAFVAKLEAQSPKPTGNKKIGRSPTFVVPNAQNVKQMLLKWLQAKTRGYNHVDVRNFSSSWANGMAFCALVHHFFPDSFDYDSLDPKNRAENFTLAFNTAEKLANADPLLDVEDMMIMGNRPDSKCVFTYCQSLYNKLRKFEAPLAPLKLQPTKEVESTKFEAVPESEDL